MSIRQAKSERIKHQENLKVISFFSVHFCETLVCGVERKVHFITIQGDCSSVSDIAHEMMKIYLLMKKHGFKNYPNLRL